MTFNISNNNEGNTPSPQINSNSQNVNSGQLPTGQQVEVLPEPYIELELSFVGGFDDEYGSQGEDDCYSFIGNEYEGYEIQDDYDRYENPYPTADEIDLLIAEDIKVYCSESLCDSIKVFQDLISDDTLKNFDADLLEKKLSPLEENRLNERIQISPKETILIWLGKLQGCKEFSDDTMRPLLCVRVLSILLFATINDEYLESFYSILKDAASSCVDNAALGINELELQKKIMECSDSSYKGTIKVLKDTFKVRLLDEIGDEFVKECLRNGKKVDDISVRLGLQVCLKEKLNLPVGCQGLNFYGLSNLTDQDVLKAKDTVNAALNNIDNLVNFFMMQEIWKERIEREFSQERDAALEPFQDKMNKLFSKAEGMKHEDYMEKVNTLSAQQKNASEEWLKSKTTELLKSTL